MKPRAYSSLAALLAHYRLLSAGSRDSSALKPDERASLTAIENALADLSPAECSALLDPSTDSASARHRQRAELKLRHVAIANGLLAD